MRERVRQVIEQRSCRARFVRPESALDVGLAMLRESFQKQGLGLAKFYGVTLQRVSSSTVQIGWKNSLTSERGVIVRVKEESAPEISAALLAELRTLREGGTCRMNA